jgi:uroporphyrinogen-III synthase
LENDELVLRASKNPHPEAVGRLKLKMGEGITGWVAEHRQPVSLAENAYADRRFQLFNELPEDHFQAFLSVPVLSRGRLVAVINMQNRPPYRYSEREIRLLSMIGFLAGAEIELARLEVENSHLSKKLESRKLIERAKGVIQRELKINEEEAYLTLQKESRQRGKSMKAIAEAILLHDEIKDRSSSS